MAGSANLADPAIIRDFRGRLARFQQQVVAAMDGAPTALDRALDQLRNELAPRWKKELGRRQEAYAEARRKYLEAEGEVKAKGQRGVVDRTSAADEQREMTRAQRRCEEAEEKLKLIRSWLLRLDGDGKDLLARCRDHDLALQELTGKALVTLDRLADRVDDYLQRGASS
jgi:hypothetical protein